MTKDEALKMAIEAMTKTDNYFEQLCSLLITFGVSPSELNMQKDTFLIKPINACKEALEQPAQEPVAWNEEEFNEIAYAYRICPAHEVKKVSERYQDLVAYVLALKEKNTCS